MAARNPPGHQSAAISAVYFLCKYISIVYSADEFARCMNQKTELRSPSESSWPHIISSYDDIQEGDNSFHPVVAIGARIINGEWFSKFEDRDASVALEFVSVANESRSLEEIYLYPPYDTCLERHYRRPFSGKDVVFPFGVTRIINWLREELCSGKLKSYLTEEAGLIKEIPSSFWLSTHSEDILRYNVSTLVYIDDKPSFGRVSIKFNDIEDAFEAKNNSSASTSAVIKMIAKSDNELVSRRGRPEKYDRSLFHAEVTTMIHNEGYPDTLTKFADEARERYFNAGYPNGRPSRDWAEEELRPTWNQRPQPNVKGGKLN